MFEENQALIDAMQRETDPTSQSVIIEQIGARGLVAAVEPLIRLVLPYDYQSGPAITALGNIGDPRAVDVLIRALAFRNLAWNAKDALVKIGDPAVEPLIAALDDPDPDVRFAVIRTLGELRDPRALAPLEDFVASELDATNRQIARTTLKTLLLDTLQRSDPALRLDAVRGLERLNDARTIDALQPLAGAAPNPDVRAAAAHAIATLIAGVERDPFDEHDLPLCSRATRRAITTLNVTHNTAIPLPDSPAQAAGAFAALQAIAGDTMQQDARACVRLLASDCLHNPAPAARTFAVEALAWLGDDSTRRLLEQVAAHDPAPAVRAAAQSALDT